MTDTITTLVTPEKISKISQKEEYVLTYSKTKKKGRFFNFLKNVQNLGLPWRHSG